MAILKRTSWPDETLQFVRLLAEIRAVGLSDAQFADLSASMDLPRAQIEELLERAEEAFEARKAEL